MPQPGLGGAVCHHHHPHPARRISAWGATPEDIAGLTPDAIGGFEPDQFAELPPEAIGGFNPEKFADAIQTLGGAGRPVRPENPQCTHVLMEGIDVLLARFGHRAVLLCSPFEDL